MANIEKPSIVKWTSQIFIVSFKGSYSTSSEVADFILDIIDYETEIRFNDGDFDGKVWVKTYADVITVITALYQEPLSEYLPHDIKIYLNETARLYGEPPMKMGS